MNTEVRANVEFLRSLVLRADADPRSQRRNFLVWGLAWVVAFGLGAALPGSWGVGLAVSALMAAVAFVPWARVRLEVAQKGPEADPGPLPLLGRAFFAMVGGAALLAYGLVWALHAWTAAAVQDGGIWLLIIGSAYLVGSMLVRGLYGWLGAWLFVCGLVIPALLPGLRAASLAYAVLGGGGFLAAAMVARRTGR